MLGINKGPITLDLETVFSRITAGVSPRAIGRGEMIALIVQNPLTNADGTANNSEVFLGSASNMIYFMIPGQESPLVYAEDLKDVYIKLRFPFPNPNGGILTAQVAAGHHGAGYAIGNILTLSPVSGTNATITVLIIGGPITVAALNAGGAGYTPLDILSVTGGNGLGRIVVDTVDGGGAILTAHLSVAGDSYVDAVGNAVTGGTGAGATFNITTTDGVLTFGVTTPGTGFTVEEIVNATGGVGAGAEALVLTVQTITPESADITVLIYRLRKGGKQ